MNSELLTLRIDTFRLSDLVEEIVSLFKPIAKSKNIKFNVNIGKNVPKLLKNDLQRIN